MYLGARLGSGFRTVMLKRGRVQVAVMVMVMARVMVPARVRCLVVRGT